MVCPPHIFVLAFLLTDKIFLPWPLPSPSSTIRFDFLILKYICSQIILEETERFHDKIIMRKKQDLKFSNNSNCMIVRDRDERE